MPGAASTGKLTISVLAEASYTWRFDNGVMLVHVDRAPKGRVLIQARQKVGTQMEVLGFTVWDLKREQAIAAVIRPYPGRTFGPDTHPVFLLEAGGEL